ncbi:unnamed protein product [Durusdinium trenchii]|uniref:Uncharacterized protein n=1 Tax=Durusdinium trenchii TaxID=1381693 RepID=A0ABP0P3J5_9DINO
MTYLIHPLVCFDFVYSGSKELHLSQRDEALLLSVLDGGVANLQKWTQAPASWWDDSRTIRVAGFRDARHCQKKLEGFPLKLQMVSAVWEDVSLEELIMVTEVIDDCAKLQFVPVMEKVQTRLVFGGGLRLLQTSIRPALLGLVSSREVDSLMKEPEMRESGWVVSTGVGLQSPLLVEKIENGGSSVLKTLVSAPPSKGKVRAIDHTSGYAFRAGDQPRSWHVHILLLSEPGGGLPHWAMEMGIYYGILDWFVAAKKFLAEKVGSVMKVGSVVCFLLAAWGFGPGFTGHVKCHSTTFLESRWSSLWHFVAHALTFLAGFQPSADKPSCFFPALFPTIRQTQLWKVFTLSCSLSTVWAACGAILSESMLRYAAAFCFFGISKIGTVKIFRNIVPQRDP